MLSSTSQTLSSASKKISHSASSSSSSFKAGDDPYRVDERLAVLKQHTLPEDPYLLSVPPSTAPLHLEPSQRDIWGVGSLFDGEEEELQYVSFLRRDQEDSFVLARPISEMSTAMDRTANSSSSVKSGADTPIKKISLSAYKDKRRSGLAAVNGAATVPAPEGAPASHTESAKEVEKKPASPGKKTTGSAETEQSSDKKKASSLEQNSAPIAPVVGERGLKADTGAKAAGETAKSPNVQQSSPHGQKRPSQEMTESAPAKAEHRDEPPPKKARTSPPASEPDLYVNKTSKSDAEATKKLPPLLSPTLPPKIERELAKHTSTTTPPKAAPQYTKTQSSAPSKSDAKQNANRTKPNATPSKQDVITASADKSPLKAPGAGVPATKKTVPKTRVVQNGNGGNQFFSALAAYNKSPSLGPVSAAKKFPPEPEFRKKIVTLKFGKDKRKNLERLLNTRSQPSNESDAFSAKKEILSGERNKRAAEPYKKKHSVHEKDTNRRVDTIAKEKPKVKSPSVPQQNVASADKPRPKDQASTGEKRARAPEDDRSQEPPSKRQQKAPENVKAPLTPKQNSLKPTARSNPGSAEKPSQNLTPKKDLNRKAMGRIESKEIHAATPQGAPIHFSESPPTPGRNDMSASEKERKKQIEDWEKKQKAMFDLGKVIKTEASTLMSHYERDYSNDKSYQRGAAMGVQSILCYMLAFIAENQIRNLQSRNPFIMNWRSLLPLVEFVQTRCRQFPRLHGFTNQLGAVIREVVHSLDRKDLLNDLPDSLSVTDGLSIERQNQIAGMLRNDRIRETFWKEGWKLLTVDNLRKEFPKTWAGRLTENDAVSNRFERISPEDWGAGYRCPLMSSVSTPIEAVRMGVNLLQDWTESRKIDWNDMLGVL